MTGRETHGKGTTKINKGGKTLRRDVAIFERENYHSRGLPDPSKAGHGKGDPDGPKTCPNIRKNLESLKRADNRGMATGEEYCGHGQMGTQRTQ